MAALLEDRALQKQLDDKGFAVVQLLSDEQVSTLRALYDRHLHDHEISDLYESSRHNDYEVNRQINEAIRREISIAGKDLFTSAKLYGGSFMVKSHKDSTILPLHQDWSVVDEDKYQTLFVWCALDDIAANNGGLFALPGSHRFFRTLRSGSYPSDRFYLSMQNQKHVQDIDLKVGEAVLYRDALLHGSHANHGACDRMVATARLTEQDADLLYFQRANQKEVDVYQVDAKFYLTHIDDLAKGLMPAGVPRLCRRRYEHKPLTEAALNEKVGDHCAQTDPQVEMIQLFRDQSLQRQFEQDGFVIIDLIDGDRIRELTDFYAGLENAPSPDSGFQVSLDNDDGNFVRTVTEKLVSVAGDSVAGHFENHRIFTASFVTKEHNDQGVVPPHQDWTFVDESRFWSATIWCPLVDVSKENGGLGLIKGSHLLYDHVRPSPSPQYSPPFTRQLKSVFPYLVVPELKAGQAIVFNNQTMHGSPPNTTGDKRLAFGIGVTHRDAQLRHYYLLPGQDRPLIEGFEIEPDFFFKYNNANLSAMHSAGQKPDGFKSIGVYTMQSRHYETGQLVDKIEVAGNTADASLMERAGPILDAMTATTPADGGKTPGSRADDSNAHLPFWKVYTPVNIVREISHRLSRR